MTLLEGITARLVDTPRLGIQVLEREADDPSTPPDRTVVFLHGSLSSSLVWQEVMQDLPRDVRAIAIDLRGYGGTEGLPVDATRGVRDFSDDVAEAMRALELPTAHFVGWFLGAAVAMQYALDHPVLSLTLQAPVPPHGLGGTRRDGTRFTDDDAGCGAGTVDPDFIRRLAAGDRGDEAPTSPRRVFRSMLVSPVYRSEHEDIWVEAMLSTSTAAGNYPGDVVPSPNWPGFAPGRIGVLNALAPMHFDVSGIVDLPRKPPILWVHGEEDAIVSDALYTDLSHLGALGITGEWPREDQAPVQPMVTQTRDVLEAYAGAGGSVTELALPGVGHAVHLERPAAFRAALLTRIGYVGIPADPAPPTETIILRSAD